MNDRDRHTPVFMPMANLKSGEMRLQGDPQHHNLLILLALTAAGHSLQVLLLPSSGPTTVQLLATSTWVLADHNCRSSKGALVTSRLDPHKHQGKVLGRRWNNFPGCLDLDRFRSFARDTEIFKNESVVQFCG